MHGRALGLGIWLGLFACLAAPAALADCDGMLDRFNRALQARDLSTVVELERAISVDAVCGRHQVAVTRRRAALQLALARQLMQQGAPAAQYEPLVVEAEQPGMLWNASETLGELRFRQKRFADATVHFERAIEIIKNTSYTPKEPDNATIQRIFERAAHSRLLAAGGQGSDPKPRVVQAPKDHRDGRIGGIFSENTRGFRPATVPIPVLFEFAKAEFTEGGEAAVRDLLTALLEQRPEVVILVGHTDERGDPGFNMRLSVDRAKAVAAYLQRHGVKGRFHVSGKGAAEPVSHPALADLEQEQVWALNRRVEWRRQ